MSSCGCCDKLSNIISGWGRLSDTQNAKMGTLLQETRVRVKTHDECAVEVARLVRYNDEAMICAHEKGTDSCSVSRTFKEIYL